MNQPFKPVTGSGGNLLAFIVSTVAGSALLFLSAMATAGLLMLIRQQNRESFFALPAMLILLFAGFAAGRLHAALSSLRGWLCGLISSLALLGVIGVLTASLETGPLSWKAVLTAVLLVFACVAGGLHGAVKR